MNGARSARVEARIKAHELEQESLSPFKSSTYVLQRVESVDSTIDEVLDCSRIASAVNIAI